MPSESGVKVIKAIRAFRENGIRFCIAIAFDRFVPQWLLRMRRFNVYEMKTDLQVTGLQATDSENVTVAWCRSEEETSAVEDFMGPMRSVVDVGADDMRACYAKVGDEIAAAFWMASNVFMESGLTIRYELEDEQAWLFAAYVAKPFRRRGIYTQMLEFVIADLQTAGKSQMLLAVNPDNIASRIVHENYARRIVGSAFAIRLLGIAACKVRGDMTVNRTFTWSHRKRPIAIRFGTSFKTSWNRIV